MADHGRACRRGERREVEGGEVGAAGAPEEAIGGGLAPAALSGLPATVHGSLLGSVLCCVRKKAERRKEKRRERNEKKGRGKKKRKKLEKFPNMIFFEKK
jgi:hypothetical protein